MRNVVVSVSARELRTIVAALRCWQNEIGVAVAPDLFARYPDLCGDALSPSEVYRLAVRLVGGGR